MYSYVLSIWLAENESHMNKYLLFLLLLFGLLSSWVAEYYQQNFKRTEKDLADARSIVNQQINTIILMQERQQKLEELDHKHTEALNAAEYKNDDLRRQLAAGTRRMYVQGKCSVPVTGKYTGSGSVGDAAAVELSADTGRNVLDIRAGIISDQVKINYLQGYIRQMINCCD